MANPLYPRPFVNQSGETIPAFAIFEMGGWVDDSKGVSVFRAVKPTKDGKVYYVNGPVAVASGSNGWAAKADGHWILWEGNSSPQLNQEWGPRAGSWAIHADGKGGFIINADPRGAAAPPPGFPTGSSTRRIRAVEQAKAEVQNKIIGTAASTASESSPQFLINRIRVISGVDPRQDPNSQTETVTVQNIFRKAYVNGVDEVTAVQSKSDQLWYPEAAEAVVEEETFIARVTGPSAGIPPAVVGGSTGSPTLRMFKGYGVRFTVKDIADPGFGNANDMAEPETEDTLSITWIGEANNGAALYPDTEERIAAGQVSSPTTIELINWVRVRINVGDRVVVKRITTLGGRVRFLIIARDCAE